MQEKQPPHLGIYVHVPFCASTCDFCAFYQEKPTRQDLKRYLNAMDLEFRQLPAGRPVETVFWGGGTPGLLPPADLAQLGRQMLARLPSAPSEWTVEMAPSTVKADKLQVLRELGVTRVSMGIQSFDARMLESLGRLHRPNQIYNAWDLLQAAGFDNLNLDLIFAIPGQELPQLRADLKEAARLGPDHISTYCLTFEEDTALYVKLSEGRVQLDTAKETRFYEDAWQQLADMGYQQYEISNFSKPGKACIHNLNTWKMHEWIGCGPSAASQFAYRRYQRPADLSRWIRGMETSTPPEESVVELDDALLLTDAAIFGLRMNEGIDLVALGQRFDAPEAAARIRTRLLGFCEGDLAACVGSHFKLTPKGRLLADAIGSELLSL